MYNWKTIRHDKINSVERWRRASVKSMIPRDRWCRCWTLELSSSSSSSIIRGSIQFDARMTSARGCPSLWHDAYRVQRDWRVRSTVSTAISCYHSITPGQWLLSATRVLIHPCPYPGCLHARCHCATVVINIFFFFFFLRFPFLLKFFSLNSPLSFLQLHYVTS